MFSLFTGASVLIIYYVLVSVSFLFFSALLITIYAPRFDDMMKNLLLFPVEALYATYYDLSSWNATSSLFSVYL